MQSNVFLHKGELWLEAIVIWQARSVTTAIELAEIQM